MKCNCFLIQQSYCQVCTQNYEPTVSKRYLLWHANLVFIAALFTVAKIQNQWMYPSSDEWIKKIWYPGAGTVALSVKLLLSMLAFHVRVQDQVLPDCLSQLMQPFRAWTSGQKLSCSVSLFQMYWKKKIWYIWKKKTWYYTHETLIVEME